jgi:hypothetical protein
MPALPVASTSQQHTPPVSEPEDLPRSHERGLF